MKKLVASVFSGRAAGGEKMKRFVLALLPIIFTVAMGKEVAPQLEVLEETSEYRRLRQLISHRVG